MNCLIVDDDKISRRALKHLISELGFLHLIGECENALEAISVLNKKSIDLVLLDVEMPKLSGLDFLKNSNHYPLVILITSKANYAVEAFEYNVVDFIVKPVKTDRFLKAITKAKILFDKNKVSQIKEKEYFFVKEKGISTKLAINDILYIQALGDYITIHTVSKKIIIHYTLMAIEKELPSHLFFRLHRSYIVALSKIDKIEDFTAYITSHKLPIAETNKTELLKKLNSL
jgi:DNA-binding LytR/AlgR family response regulator